MAVTDPTMRRLFRHPMRLRRFRPILHLRCPPATKRAIATAVALSKSGREILVNFTRLQTEPQS
jgi:hypothetical protein